jgi:hypothetical protein
VIHALYQSFASTRPVLFALAIPVPSMLRPISLHTLICGEMFRFESTRTLRISKLRPLLLDSGRELKTGDHLVTQTGASYCVRTAT